VLGATTGLLAIFLHSVVDFNMQIPANAILAVALMALLSSHLRFTSEKYWVKVGPVKRALASAVLLAGLVYLGQQGARRAREYVWLERASQASLFSPAQAELLKKAFAVDPSNEETAYAIGDALRRQSQEGGDSYRDMAGVDYRQLADQAREWFGRSQKLNPWNGYSFLAYGWCLDWVDRKAEAGPYFDQAEQLDPNGYYTMASIGLHYVELGNYAAAKCWFERSLRLKPKDNIIARDYLEITQRRLMEAATNDLSARLSVLSH
jgi:tetratricopeptide (TPR) repeat protein